MTTWSQQNEVNVELKQEDPKATIYQSKTQNIMDLWWLEWKWPSKTLNLNVQFSVDETEKGFTNPFGVALLKEVGSGLGI